MISVVVTVHDVEPELLRACLNSLRRQTLRPNQFEVILVDDASRAQTTIATIEECVDQMGNVHVVRHSTNRGPNHARRSGVAAAKGDSLVFVDGDDVLTRDGLEILSATARRTAADIVTSPLMSWLPAFGGYALIPSTALPLPQDRIERVAALMRHSSSFMMCGRLLNRSIVGDVLFDMPERTLHEDLVTTVRVHFAGATAVTAPHPVYYYTVNPASITTSTDERHLDGMFFAFEEWLGLARQHQLLDRLEPCIQQGTEKLLNALAERIVLNPKLDDVERVRLLVVANERYDALPMGRASPRYPGTELLAALASADEPQQLVKAFASEQFDRFAMRRQRLEHWPPASRIVPSAIALQTKDKIVFVCQVDDHLRIAARFTRELQYRGHPCVILDNSQFAERGRQLDRGEHRIVEGIERIAVPTPPYGSDWLSTAKLAVLFVDHAADYREALEFRHLLGMPTIGFVEGTTDFLRTDFERPSDLPYRRCDHVLLAGEHDAQYFADRSVAVVGLPEIEDRATTMPSFPATPLAVLNVNFADGGLENRRELFLAAAREGIHAAGFDLAISQHPLDRSDLGAEVSSKPQSQLIAEGSVFVSRFATGILEALASGKAVVYFNPHGERAGKFDEPMGAYELAMTPGELTLALARVRRDIEAGVDFRARARDFLRAHAGLGLDSRSAIDRFADFATAIAEDEQDVQLSIARQAVSCRSTDSAPDNTYGPMPDRFDRIDNAYVLEEELIGRLHDVEHGVMFDVAPSGGTALGLFLAKGWVVHAFEPDPARRAQLHHDWASQRRLVVNEFAAPSSEGQGVDLDGLGSAMLQATALDLYLDEWSIDHVDVLRVASRGRESLDLDAYPWERAAPDVILVGFDDSETAGLGASLDHLAQDMERRGYGVYVSIWYPPVGDSSMPTWRGIEPYRTGLALADVWSRLVAFRDAGEQRGLYDVATLSVKFDAGRAESSPGDDPLNLIAEPAATARRQATGPPRLRWCADTANRFGGRIPAVDRALRDARRAVANVARRSVHRRWPGAPLDHRPNAVKQRPRWGRRR